jgi:hypothetical protein
MLVSVFQIRHGGNLLLRLLHWKWPDEPKGEAFPQLSDLEGQLLFENDKFYSHKDVY